MDLLVLHWGDLLVNRGLLVGVDMALLYVGRSLIYTRIVSEEESMDKRPYYIR